MSKNNGSNPVGRTNPTIDRALDVLVPLVQAAEPLPRESIKLSTYRALRLIEAGLVRRVDVLRTGKQGRPAYLYAPTSKAKKAVERRIKSGAVAVVA